MAPSKNRRNGALAVVAGLAIAVTPVALAQAAAERAPAPLLGIGLPTAIDGRYIVVLDAEASARTVATTADSVRRAGGTVHYT